MSLFIACSQFYLEKKLQSYPHTETAAWWHEQFVIQVYPRYRSRISDGPAKLKQIIQHATKLCLGGATQSSTDSPFQTPLLSLFPATRLSVAEGFYFQMLNVSSSGYVGQFSLPTFAHRASTFIRFRFSFAWPFIVQVYAKNLHIHYVWAMSF